MNEAQIKEYLKENLRLEVDTAMGSYGSPTNTRRIKVSLMLEEEVISEGECEIVEGEAEGYY